MDLHGQHETQSLLHAEAQRDILDAFAHARGGARRRAPRRMPPRPRSGPGGSRSQRRRDEVRRRADYLRHVVGEIDGAKVKPGEDEALQVEARRLSQAGALVEQAQRIVEALEGDSGNALGALGHGRAGRSASLEKVDPAAAEWRELLDGAYANLSELAPAGDRLRRVGAGRPRAAGDRWSGGGICSSG